MTALFDREACVDAWLRVERTLAWAQVQAGIVPEEAAKAIEKASDPRRVDLDLLDRRTRTVGYPILPLLEQIADGAPEDVGRYLHWGATTQDIMDTGDALRFAAAIDLVDTRLVGVGDELMRLVQLHYETVIAGRTHSQHAVPTTFGAKLAVWLEESVRHLERLAAVRRRIAVVQLFGAAGTSAALGPCAAEIRRALAAALDLADRAVPTHTARDNLAELGFVLAAITATCGKVSREIAELARTELREVHERTGDLRGASSTMPQKRNPIDCEGVIGLALFAVQQVPVLLHAMQPLHERATGEWQAEWDVLPLLFSASSAALVTTAGMLSGLEVAPDQMLMNLDQDHGLIMAEAAMMALAGSLGRKRAHEVVYEASRAARESSIPLIEALREALPAEVAPNVLSGCLLDPADHLGETMQIARAAVESWTVARER